MKSMIAAALLATFAGVSFASAQDVASPSAPTRSMKPFDKIEGQRLAASLEHRGITGITSVQNAGDGYLVTAMQNTQPVTVWADPQSGDIQVLNRSR